MRAAQASPMTSRADHARATRASLCENSVPGAVAPLGACPGSPGSGEMIENVRPPGTDRRYRSSCHTDSLAGSGAETLDHSP